MKDTKSAINGCTEEQRRALKQLPASTNEIAGELEIQPSGVRSLISRIREKGITIDFDSSAGEYDAPNIEAEDITEPQDVESVSNEEVIQELREDGLTYKDFTREYGLSKKEATTLIEKLQQSGYNVDFKVTDDKGTRLWFIPEERDTTYHVGDGDGVYTFALIGDTHLGSKVEHLEELHDFYDRLQERGISHVYHAGDITDGWKVHKGHLNEIKGEAAGWQRLLDYTVENYPSREGVSTFFIEGNHDRKYHRRNGLHLGELLDRRRDDLNYCGDSQATFVLDAANDIDLELIHPSGGKPYTKAYRAQTLYRERPVDDRPTISGIGHLHGKIYAEAEDVEAFYVGCWKGLTTWGKRKGHDSEIGGWVVEVEIEDGELRRLVPEWIGYESRVSEERYGADDIERMSSE